MYLEIAEQFLIMTYFINLCFNFSLQNINLLIYRISTLFNINI